MSYRYILSAKVTQPGVPFECIGVKKPERSELGVPLKRSKLPMHTCALPRN